MATYNRLTGNVTYGELKVGDVIETTRNDEYCDKVVKTITSLTKTANGRINGTVDVLYVGGKLNGKTGTDQEKKLRNAPSEPHMFIFK